MMMIWMICLMRCRDGLGWEGGFVGCGKGERGSMFVLKGCGFMIVLASGIGLRCVSGTEMH